MLTIRRSAERGHLNHGWLDTYHSFSFSEYYDPLWMGFKSLRVINQDIVMPGQGFPSHGHKDMEIITYILRGTLAHKDSMGNEAFIRTGEIQRMTAGTGIRHSEYNASQQEPVELLQIWIMPERNGLTPSYEQKAIPELAQGLTLLVSAEATPDTLMLHQDASIWLGKLVPREKLAYAIKPGRHLWLQMISGQMHIAGQVIAPGDGLAISDESILAGDAIEKTDFLLFDLADFG